VEEKHKRSKSHTMNSIKSKKVSKSQEQSVLIADQHSRTSNNKTSYNIVNEYLENTNKNLDGMYSYTDYYRIYPK
jgi:hypothetical protein